MALFNVNDHQTSSREKTSREILPEGEYVAMIVDDYQTAGVDIRTSKAGNPYLNLSLRIITPDEHQSRVIYDMISLSPKALFKLAEVYRACEPEKDRQVPFDIESEEHIHAALYYKPFICHIIHETFNSKKRAKVAKYTEIPIDNYDDVMTIAQECLNENPGQWGSGPRFELPMPLETKTHKATQEPSKGETRKTDRGRLLVNPPEDEDIPF
jgi:hypothetical protein